MKAVKLIGIIALAVNLLILSAQAATVSYEDAKNIAVNYTYSETRERVTVDNTVSNVASTNLAYKNKAFHIIMLKPKGWVAVSGDDTVIPVIAYSTESSLSSRDSLPPGFIEWMDNAGKQIEEAIKADINSSAALEGKWNKLQADPSDYLSDTVAEDKAPVSAQAGPLLMSKWNQGPHWNAQCPMDNVTDKRTSVGCVATAMAQIMNYHKWPDRGVGSNSYTTKTRQISISESFNTTYGWNTNTDEAKISYHAGVSVNMNYTSDESGASPLAPVNAFKNNFKYYSGGLENRDDNTKTYWHEKIKADIDNRRPIFYGGYKPLGQQGGHAFVLDGYRTSDWKYHFNWGWGGVADGFFSLNSLNPGSGHDYTRGQMAIFNIKPKGTTPPTPQVPATPSVSASDGTLTSGVVISYYSAKATSYKVYRDGAYLALTYGRSFKDTKAYPGRKYSYSAKACSSGGCSGLAYDIGWRKKIEPVVPTTPSIYATDGTLTSGVVIKFYSAKATSYKVYRNGMFIGATKERSFKDTKAYPGRKYSYSAKACSSGGCSGLAYDIGWRKKIEPVVPTTPSIYATDGTLTSGVVIKFYSAKATSYKVYRNGMFIGATKERSFKDTKAYPGRKYSYSAKACSSGGCSGLAYDIGWRGKIPTLPAPTTITASDNTLKSGVLIGSYYVKGAAHYKLYKASSAYGSKKYLGLTSNSSFKDTTGWPGTKYYYFVKACNSSNQCSNYSAYNIGMRKK